MSDKDKDLSELFGQEVPSPPSGPGLVPELDIEPVRVELAPGIEHSFASMSDARVVLGAIRPRKLPRVTKFRPVHYWIEMDGGQFVVVEYSARGESRRGSFASVNEAWQHLMALRRTAKTGALNARITEL